MLKELRELTALDGISGNEGEVREYIKRSIEGYCDEVKADRLGNLIAYKKGAAQGSVRPLKVMLSAHMDEVGFMVTGYSDGMLKFKPVGGVDERILPGKRVLVGAKKLPGVIGAKPVHLQEKEERSSSLKLKSLYIDIGAEKREDAEKLAPLGEYIAFSSGYAELGGDRIKAKALDDRAGCAIIIDVLKERYEFDLYGCFTVQEEIGLRGSETAAYAVKPDIALVLEGTTCSDVPGVEKQDYSTVLGGGAALTIMDRTAYADRNLVRFLYELAVKNGIKVQYKQTTTGGNDAGKIQRTGMGAKVASLSVPCRYIHSPVSVMSSSDFEGCLKLTELFLKEIGQNRSAAEMLVNGGKRDV